MIYNSLAGLVSGIIGSMGMGGGAVLIIYLSLFCKIDPNKSGGINLMFFVPIALVSVIIYSFKKLINWKTTLPISAIGVLGAFLGVMLSYNIQNKILSKILGGFILTLGVIELVRKNNRRG